MGMPGFTADLSVYEPRRPGGRFRRVVELDIAVSERSVRPQQETCESYQCPSDGRPMLGEFPNCYCEELPPPGCEAEFACPPGLVSYGQWPDCGCKNPDNPDPPPGEGGGEGGGGSFSPGLGGSATCDQFYTCPPRYHAEDGGEGVCVCK